MTNNVMPTVTVRMPDRMLEGIDQVVEDGYFPNKSEAIRASVRRLTENGG